MKKAILFVTLILFSFVLISCGKSQCRADVDCPTATCFQSTCQKGMCVKDPILNCCGNQKCEANVNENKCTCPDDCGACRGATDAGLIYKCTEENTCIATEDLSVKQNFKETPVLDVTDTGKVTGKLYFTYDYFSPFNVNRDLFKMSFRREALPDAASDFKIEKVRVVYKSETKDASGKITEQKVEILGETDVNQVLYDDRQISQNEIRLKKSKVEPVEIKVDVEIFYNYKMEEQGIIREVKGIATQTAIPIKLIKPEPTMKCEKCDDRACAISKCENSTEFFCTYSYKPNCCGNRICELGENKCNCPIDCGECFQSYGLWIKDQCFNNRCVGKVADPTLIQPIILSDTRLLSPRGETVTSIVEYTYNNPFDINKDRFHIKLTQSYITDKVEDFSIRRVELLNRDQLLAKYETEINLRKEDDWYAISLVPIVSLKKNEEKEFDLTVKIHYRAKTSTGTDGAQEITDDRYTYSIGKVLFINPEIS
jgi:hypothetical protein